MPPQRDDVGVDGKSSKNPTLRPPLYNAEDYVAALKQLFSSSSNSAYAYRNVQSQNQHQHNQHQQGSPSMLIEHTSNGNHSEPKNQPEMGMKKFLNGSELLFKLEADLRHAFPSFVQEFVSGHCEGVPSLLEALRTIQAALDECSGLREQRKILMDEQKCLHCIKFALRNIEAVSKLASYTGGLYPLAAAMVSTVTATRIIALEVLTCVCSEGGVDGHNKVAEALSTLRLRMGEPIRCKLLVGALSSAPPGPFQARGIKFLTNLISSAPSPKHKVHIQCELEEAGFNSSMLRKGAELGGARESREVHVELDEWDRVIIDVDTLTRQNCQLRNSVATLQQELATLKDKLKRMDSPPKFEKEDGRKRRGKRGDEVISTPVDSEEEAEQIHQILEDLNNIVNTEMRVQAKKGRADKEQEIVPVHLVKSPPKKKLSSSNPVIPRPWPGSSASDDDDSDIVEMLEGGADAQKPNVLKVVQQLESMELGKAAPKAFREKHQKLQNLPIAMSKSISVSPAEPKPDYSLPNFHKANHMASKFANFKSPKLYSASPEQLNSNSGPDSSSSSKNNVSSGYAEVYEKSSNGSKYNYNISPRFSPVLLEKENGRGKGRPSSNKKGRSPGSGGSGSPSLRRSESLHASLAAIGAERSPFENGIGMHHGLHPGQYPHGPPSDKWKSMESLGSRDDNFTLRWRYPAPHQFPTPGKGHGHSPDNNSTPSPKSGSKTAKLAQAKNGHGHGHSHAQGPKGGGGGGELCVDYRQSRFTKNGKSNNSGTSSPLNIFSRYGKNKERERESKGSPEVGVGGGHKEKENMKMFSLPPIMMPHAMDSHHRLTDLPSGLY